MILHICQPLIDPNSTMDIINDNLLRLNFIARSISVFFLCFGEHVSYIFFNISKYSTHTTGLPLTLFVGGLIESRSRGLQALVEA